MPPSGVLVTGGSRGIGAEIVRLLATDGFAVAFTYQHRQADATALADELRSQGHEVLALRADLTQRDGPSELFTKLGSWSTRIEALVNNAGITGPLGTFDAVSMEVIRDVMEVNVVSLMQLTQLFLRQWKQSQVAGNVVNISSIAASLGAAGEYVHYAASKAAVEGFTVGLAKELASSGIRVNAVSPGTTLTEIHAAAGEPGRPQRVAEKIPMKRPAEATEIAEAVRWLISDRSSYVTGAILKVAGGL